MISNSDFARAIRAVRDAGRIALINPQDVRGVQNKGVADFVTNVDREVQTVLLDRLSGLDSHYPVISEEGQVSRTSPGPRWIIDPIDGTTNLLHGYPHFGISVALATGEGIVAAIVYHPHRDEMFTARAGEGAWLNEQRIHVSKTSLLKDSVIGFGLPYDKSRSAKIFELANTVFTKTQDLRRSGSASLDLAYIACARLDGFFEFDLHPWDVSAGLLLLLEAGGLLTDFRGGRVNVDSRCDVVATNGALHNELRDLLQSV